MRSNCSSCSRLLRGLASLCAVLALTAGAVAGVTPLPISPKAKTERALAEEDAAWARRVWVAPFRERTAGQPWQKEAAAIIEEILAARAELTIAGAAPKLLPEADRVQGLGCDDPLLEFLCIEARRLMTGDVRKARRALRSLLPRLDALAAPRGLASAAGIAYLSVAHVDSDGGKPDEVERCLRWQAEAVEDGSFTPDEWHLFVRQIVASHEHGWMVRHGAALLATTERTKRPEWVAEVLRGYNAVALAWASRGGDWAGKVTDDGWKGFESGLNEARRSLTRAWELRPDRPEAAAKMITVAMGGAAARGETTQTWRDRTFEAVCDYSFAIDSYTLALLPRWGGSHAEMLDFAERCLATGRFDTQLPVAVVTVCAEINRDFSDLRELYRKPRFKELILAMSRGLAEEPTRARERDFRLGFLAVNAWLCDEPKLAQEALGRVNGLLHPHAAAKLRAARTDERAFRGEMAVLAGPAAGVFGKAEAARRRAFFDDAVKLGGESLTLAGEVKVPREFLEGWLAVARVEQTLARGEWADISATPSLHGWTERTGTWRAGPKGLPECVGDGRAARIVFGARLGGNFELRAEIATSESKPGHTALGLFFGHQPGDENMESWQACSFYWDDGQKSPVGAYLLRNSGTETPRVPSPASTPYVIELKVQAGRMTWKLNGKTIHEDIPIVKPITAEGLIGMGSYASPEGSTLTLEKLTVRRVPAQ